MDERLKRLIAKREQAAKERENLLAQRNAIVEVAEGEAREDLSPEEDTEFRGLTEKVKTVDAEIVSFDERITELSEEIERAGKVTDGALAVRRAQARVQSVTESLTYTKGNGRSYLQDLVRHGLGLDGSGESTERLQRHAQDVREAKEYRDLDRVDGSGGYFVPPVWLMGSFAELARAGRATANLVQNLDLPSGTDSINIPKVATGTATGVQEADNSATGIGDTDLTDAAVNAGVKTIAGQQDVAIQLLDQSPVNFDEVIFRDLVADYATRVNAQVLSGTNANGQVKGILAASGTETVTYTDTAPDVKSLYQKLSDAIQRVHTLRFRAPQVIVMHPRRWAWLLSAFDTTDRPLIVPSGPGQNQIGTFGGVVAEQVVGQMQGLPVVTDPGIPTNLGSGTNEDVILVLKADDLLLWESSIRSRVLPEVGSDTLTVRLQVYGYLAFTAERYPKSVVKVTGTGLVAPTF